jgi:hypothetical protein
MWRAFADPEAQNKALQKLGYMKQGTKDFCEFISEFDQTLLEAGAFGGSEPTKKSWLRNAISFELAKAIVAAPEPDTYEELCQQLHRVSHRLVSLKRLTTTSRRISRPQTSPSLVELVNNITHKPDKTDWEPKLNKRRAKWVSKRELDKRMKEKRCRRCGASGHYVNNCPYDTPSPLTDLPKAANTKAAEPELEVEELWGKGQGKAENHQQEQKSLNEEWKEAKGDMICAPFLVDCCVDQIVNAKCMPDTGCNTQSLVDSSFVRRNKLECIAIVPRRMTIVPARRSKRL